MSHRTFSRLFVDCSSTIQCDFNSGIQRVVRSICEQANRTRKGNRVETFPVYGRVGQIYHANSLWPESPQVDLISRLSESPAAKLYFKHARSVYKRTKSRRFQKLFLPESGHSGIFKLPKLALEGIQKKRATLPQEQAIEFRDTDVLLMADASWMAPNWEAIANAKSRGAMVGTLVYDVIPLSHPQFFPDDLVVRFQDWFSQALQTSDFFLCISECVASDVREQLILSGRDTFETEQICRSFPLGSDLQSAKSEEAPSENFQSLFADRIDRCPHLMVGTLEPRKNHQFVLDAFQELWDSGADESLCIVGRVGWNCEKTLQRIREHPEFNRRLFLCNDASDADVNYAYRRAKTVIMASHTEGFGLPIIEALEYHQTVLASDTPIHREVGGDCIDYFSIDSNCHPLTELICSLANRTLSPEPRANQDSKCVHWDESFGEILKTISAIHATLHPVDKLIQKVA